MNNLQKAFSAAAPSVIAALKKEIWKGTISKAVKK